MRTGQNTTETILNTSNVNVNQFGKLFALPTDGQVYAQPLYVPGVKINGVTHNVLIVATEADSVYAYDADSIAGSNSAPLWKASLVDSAHGAGAGENPLNSATMVGCTDIQPNIGITATPVIDSASNTIYVEAASTNGTSFFHRLHALDLLTGDEKSPGPTQITATVAGTGDGSTGGQLQFNSLQQMARLGLLLVKGVSNSTIYVGFASHCDYSPFHGWLFAYDEPTLTQKSLYVTTPNGGDGGFWMSGAGIAADSSGNIYIPSGNGDFDTTNDPATETSDTLLKFGTTNQTLTLLDYFTPYDQATLQANDWDLGSGGTLLLPTQTGSYPDIMIQTGKEGQVYVVDRDQLTTGNSHYCSGCTSDPEIIEESASGAIGRVFSVPAYWNSNIYFWGVNDVLKSIPVTNGLPDFSSISSNSTEMGYPGATPSISSNGTTSGTAIVWAVDTSKFNSSGPATVYAFDATNVSSQLWNSNLAANSRDVPGLAAKYAVPTISNGKVYISTSSEVDVYGLLSGVVLQTATPQISPSSDVYVGSVAVTISDTTSGAMITYTTDGSTPVPGSNGTTIPAGGSFTLTSSATVTAIASASGYNNSLFATAAYNVVSSVPPASFSFGGGFTGETGLTLNGTAMIVGNRLRLTNGVVDEAGSAFFSTPVNVQSFTNTFTFQLTNANADGFTFTIQGANANALGPGGGGLGYGASLPGGALGIPTSVAVKFDIFSDAGEGNDSTGIYTNGASPTVPAVEMSSSGVNLHSGDTFQVQMSYNGTNLAMTITDTTTGGTFSTTFTNINIPATVGGNTAYVGFTGSTGGLTATQDILSWSYTSGTTSGQVATPQISPAAGSYVSSVAVTITDTTPGATITYTTDGSTPVPGSHGTAITSGGSFTLTSSATVTAIASASGDTNSSLATAAYTISSPPINFSSGFSAETTLTLNGSAKINGTRLRLTDGGASEAGSAFFSTPVNVQSFTNTFTFQLTSANADGFTFTIQGVGPTALGTAGGNLGYTGIPTSVAVKFDLFSNSGEGSDSTGLYTNGATPMVPAVDMSSSGVNLHSGDTFQVQMSYNGTNLAMTITDTSTGGTFSTTFTNINIPATVGGNTAYVGFTGGTGGLTATQDILTWSYTPGTAPTQVATPQISPVAGSYVNSVAVTITDTTTGATITYTTDGSTPVPGSHGTAIASGGSFTLTSSATVTAIASASGDTNSNTATAAYTITAPTQVATPQISPAAGTYAGSVAVILTDTTAGATITYTTDGSTPVPGSHGTAIASGGSFTLTSSATVTAIASLSGDTNSNTATSAYTITVAKPQISPAAGSYVSSVAVTITDTTPGATITYTTDGSTPVPGSHGTAITSGGSFTLTSSATVTAIASASGYTNSPLATAAYTITSPPPVNFSSGFSAETTLTLNGSAKINGTRLRLTDGGASEAGSAFFSTPVNVQSFTNTFTFQLTSANADGFTFTIQGVGPTALGTAGGNLGYTGIPTSVAVKFDLFSNSGEGSDSTGLYTNGATPMVPAVDMSSSGVNLHSGDTFQVQMSYNGTNLAMTITDTSTGGTFSTTFTNINIPATVGGNTAYVGFTGGTGGLTATQDILTWSYTPGTAPTQVATPQISPVAGSYVNSVAVTITDTTTGATITYTTDGSTPVPGSHGTAIASGGSFTLTSSATVTAIASASGDTNSNTATAAYTITAPTQVATPQISPAAGTYAGSVAVILTDTTAGATITYTTDGSTPVPGSHGTAIASGGSFTLTSSATVTAIASLSGDTNSNTATSAYTITVAKPQISPAAGSYVSSVAVTITDTTPGATITYTTDGSTPVPGSHGTAITSGGSFTLTSSATVTAIASASGYTNSPLATAAYTITSPPPVNFSSGFSAETTLTLNGSAKINGTRLRLTDGGASEAGSAFFSTPVNVQSFTNTFTFQLTSANADGFTFTIQGVGPTALGTAGGNLGYTGIPTSVAVKFDLFSNSGEGSDSTGLYTNGATPMVPAVDMSSSGVNLHSGDTFQVQMSYNGTNLAMTITDTSTGGTFSTTFTNINIPATVGGNTAYVGFTGGTGGLTATQDILTWSYTP